MKFKGLLLIDLDGCLVDSLSDTTNSYIRALNDIDYVVTEAFFQTELFGLSFHRICDVLSIPPNMREILRSKKNLYFSETHRRPTFNQELIDEINKTEYCCFFKCIATHASAATVKIYTNAIHREIGEFAILCSDNFPYQKTDLQYFTSASDLFRLQSSDITLFDDNVENIRVARESGCNAVHFELSKGKHCD